MLRYATNFISHMELYHNMAYFKQIRRIKKFAWLKFHFDKNRKKRSFMKHNVLDNNI